jgi:hypothetical protein
MTRRLLWVMISVLSTLVLFGLSLAAFAFGRGDWVAFFRSPARVGAIVVSLALCALVVFCDFGGMDPGRYGELMRERPFAVSPLRSCQRRYPPGAGSRDAAQSDVATSLGRTPTWRSRRGRRRGSGRGSDERMTGEELKPT